MKLLEDKTKINVQNNIIKSIAISDINKNIIFEGSYALYKILSNNLNNNFINDRVLNITDLDIDTYDLVSELWEDSQNGVNVSSILNKFIRDMTIKVFENKYFGDVKVISGLARLVKYENRGTPAFKTNFVVHMVDKQTNDDFKLKVDLLFVKNPHPHFFKNITIDGSEYNVMVYEIEKYYVGKIYSLLKHYDNFKKEYGDNKLSKAKDAYPTLITTYKDIDFVRKFYPLDHSKINFYIGELHTQEYGDKDDVTFKFKEIYDKVKNGYKR